MVDITQILEAGLERKLERRIEIIETPTMYPVKERVWDNWTPFILKGLREVDSVGKLAIIGANNGALAIGALMGLDLEGLTVTDIEPGDLRKAVKNIYPFLGELPFRMFDGEFLDPLIVSGEKYNTIFENLPNIPLGRPVDLKERGSFFYDGGHMGATLLFEEHLLSSHYRCLGQALQCLNPGGSLVMSIGGRMDLEILRELVECRWFRDGGPEKPEYHFSELVAGLKIQTEAREMLEAYAKYEVCSDVGHPDYAEFIDFHFYWYREAAAYLQIRGFTEPFFMDGNELKKELQPFRVTASKALQLYERGVEIGHTVHVVRAKLIS